MRVRQTLLQAQALFPARAVRPFTRLALLALAALALYGCGYGFTGQAADPTRLPPEYANMAIARVDNPTLEAWVEPRLRSLLRDEFNRRGLVHWAERSKATSLFTMTIKSYQRQSAVTGQQEQTLKLSTSMTYTCRVTRAADGAVLWDSGEQSQTETFFYGDSQGADMRLTDLAVRRIADLMTENY